jgi:C4-dicarboxylate-specific signal transduction histidine kinase
MPKSRGVREPLSVPGIVDDALQMYAYALRGYQVEVIREYQEVPVVTLDKHKVLRILLNLIRNAQHALDENLGSTRLESSFFEILMVGA